MSNINLRAIFNTDLICVNINSIKLFKFSLDASGIDFIIFALNYRQVTLLNTY